jgi:hypothetical protein
MKKLLFIILFLPLSCFVEHEKPVSKLLINLSFNSTKSSKLADNPFFIEAKLEADDFKDDVISSWHGDPEVNDNIELELDAISGTNRRLSIVAFINNNDTIETYYYYESSLVLEPGEQNLNITLNKKDDFTLNGIIESYDGTPLGISIIDIQTDLIFPHVTYEFIEGNINFQIENIPTGRFFYLKILQSNNTYSPSFTFCPIYHHATGEINKTFNTQEETCSEK